MQKRSHSNRSTRVTSYVQKIPLKHTGTAMAAQNVHLRLRTCHPSKERIVALKMHSIWCGENSTDQLRPTNGDGINKTGVEKSRPGSRADIKVTAGYGKCHYILKDTRASKLLHSARNKYYYIIHVDRIKMCNFKHCIYAHVCMSRDVNCRKPGVLRHIC